MSTDGERHGGWPSAVRFLLERHPRATWPSAHSASAAFWLEVHRHLRRDAAGLEAAGAEYRAGRSPPAQLAVLAAPRLHGLIAAMQGHHQIEDFQYFPEFRRLDPRLEAGFTRLEQDHQELGRRVDEALTALGNIRVAAQRAEEPSAAATLRLATERFVDAASELCRTLSRHLDDEEDLVVPLLIERGTY